MLLQERSICLCRGENGKPFSPAELWPALIVRIHWDFTINAIHKFQNTKNIFFGFTHAPLKFISAPRKDNIGQLWQLMTASNVGGWTQAWQAKGAVFRIEGFVCKRFLPFFLTLSPFFYLRHFSRLASDNIEWSQIEHLVNFTQRLISIMERDWNVKWG